MHLRVLAVDDDPVMRSILRSTLEMRYSVDVVESVDEALLLIGPDRPPYAVVLADMVMPRRNGVELLAEFEKRSPLTTRMLLTGDPKQQTVVAAVNVGRTFRFLAKPFKTVELFDMVDAAIKQHEMLLAEQSLLETTLRSSITILLEIVSTAEPLGFELSQRLRRTVRHFALEMKLPNAWELEMAAALARIGVATLPGGILRKLSSDASLEPREEAMLATVPEIGWNLLKGIPRMEAVAAAVRYQSKNFDGTGTPHDDRTREEIPLGARILRIFTARALLELDGVAKAPAHKQMRQRSGEFDPALLRASFELFPDYILPGISAQAQVQTLKAAELQLNQAVVTDIKTKDGLKIVAAGSRLTAMMIQRLRNHVELQSVAEPFCVQDLPTDPTVKALAFPTEVAVLRAS